jgi:[acyl-carrier-protein] S-malonyltransferase
VRVVTAAAASAPAIAFPGQGPKYDALVTALNAHRGHPLIELFLDRFGLADPAGIDLRDTRMSQPAVYACGLASVAAAYGRSYRAPVTLGHSLGEITALAHAGAIEDRDGFDLVCARGAICHDALAASPGAMLAVMGGRGQADIEWIRRQAAASSGGVLEVAGLNGRRQTVLSGHAAAVDAAVAMAASLGLIVEVLPIGGAFHSPLLAAAVAPWRQAVESTPFAPPRTAVVSAIDAAVHTDPAELRELVVRALLLPVRWLDAVCAVRDLGCHQVWDAGPGETLKKLGRRDHIIDYVDLISAVAS